MSQQVEKDSELFDFVAIGAGPSNLSLAVQASERHEVFEGNWLVLEKNSQVRWHSGMLLPGSRLDTHFAKDLVTMVDPTNKFSFLNYLLVHGKLESFLNCGNTCPFRADFDKYIEWVAKELENRILTSSEVTRIETTDDGSYLVHTNSDTGTKRLFRSRSVVIGVGASPRTICDINLHDSRIIHSSNFLHQIEGVDGFRGKNKVLVVGGGQSAAELLNYCLLHTQNEITCMSVVRTLCADGCVN